MISVLRELLYIRISFSPHKTLHGIWVERVLREVRSFAKGTQLPSAVMALQSRAASSQGPHRLHGLQVQQLVSTHPPKLGSSPVHLLTMPAAQVCRWRSENTSCYTTVRGRAFAILMSPKCLEQGPLTGAVALLLSTKPAWGGAGGLRGGRDSRMADEWPELGGEELSSVPPSVPPPWPGPSPVRERKGTQELSRDSPGRLLLSQVAIDGRGRYEKQ